MKYKKYLNILKVPERFFEVKNRYNFLEERLSFCEKLLSSYSSEKINSHEQASQALVSVLRRIRLPEDELNVTELTALGWESFYLINKNIQENRKGFKKRFPTERDSFIFLCALIAKYVFECYFYDDVNRLSLLTDCEVINLLSEKAKSKLNIQVGKAMNILEIFTLMCYHIRRTSRIEIYKNLDVYQTLYEILSYCIRENTNEIEKYYLLPTVTEIPQTEKRTKKYT